MTRRSSYLLATVAMALVAEAGTGAAIEFGDDRWSSWLSRSAGDDAIAGGVDPLVEALSPSLPSWMTGISGADASARESGTARVSGPASATSPTMMSMMMGMMGARAPQPIYPTLMALPPDLPAGRAASEQLARARIEDGLGALSAGMSEAMDAVRRDDLGAAEGAVSRLRAGLAHLASGVTTRKLLAEGAPPAAAALTWFKDAMSLVAAPSAPVPSMGWRGFSWLHVWSMAGLAGFAAAALLVFWARRQRAAELARGLTVTAGRTAVGTAASGLGSPPASATPALDPVTLPPSPASAPPPASRPGVSPAVTSGPWTGELEVVAIFQETPAIKTFRLMTPGGGEIPFAFAPGQFLWITLPIESGPLKRSYTIASAPGRRDIVEITVKLEDKGVGSGFLHRHVRVGDRLTISAPHGGFIFKGDEAPSIVLIGGGVGITPLMSVIRHLTTRAWPGRIDLLYAARTTREFVFREEIEYLQRRHPNLHVFASMTRVEGDSWLGPQGRLTTELVRATVPDAPTRRFHLCGPPAMMAAVKASLAELGVPKAQVKFEAFGVEKRVPSAEAPPARAPSAEAASRVTFLRSGKSADLPVDRSILDVADDIGVPIDSSCRSGTCGTCKIKLVSGAVTMEVEDGLEPADKAAGYILACQARATADVAVDA